MEVVEVALDCGTTVFVTLVELLTTTTDVVLAAADDVEVVDFSVFSPFAESSRLGLTIDITIANRKNKASPIVRLRNQRRFGNKSKIFSFTVIFNTDRHFSNAQIRSKV